MRPPVPACLAGFLSRFVAGALLSGLAVAGCASLPAKVERIPSHALPGTGETALARAVAADLPAGESGFRIMAAGNVAYGARLALADSAERSLDLQYYWVAADAPTRTLFAALRRAADRGVRVRLLLDDLAAAQHDAGLLRFSIVPNVQVRVFNPFIAGRANTLTRALFSAGDLARVSRRMHNKLFIADNALAIVGGRNLTAEYFSDDRTQNFADLDVLAGGAIAPRLSRVFDEYWNSDAAYPIEAVAAVPGRAPSRAAPRAMMTEDHMPSSRFDLARLRLIRAPARVLADNPAKALDGPTADGSAIVYQDVVSILDGATREVLIISPYFIPTADLMLHLRALRARGVTVRVLTNSLASTDMPPVFAAYSRHRLELLRLGVELHELRASPGRPAGLLKTFTESRTALHAKAVLVDHRVVFVGSMNLDPRSRQKNTEDGLIIFSPELGQRMARIFALGASLDNSYTVSLCGDGASPCWTTRSQNGEVQYTSEPDAGLLRRLLTPLLRVAVPEGIL